MFSDHTKDWQGKMLGRYRLLQVAGRGGMGEVWLAEDSQLRRQVAVKLLPPVLAGDASYLEAFAYEARTAAALEHPHVLSVHDFGQQQLTSGEVVTYLIMPYIQGGSLSNRIRSVRGPLVIDESLHYLKQAALAIDYAHSQRVLHRDIKPGNMLLQQHWLFLTDFGIAKLLASSTYRDQTHAGAGTPEYMAPEQAQGHAEPASDRYSLAIIAYQLFTNVLPFHGDTPYETMLKHISQPLPPAQQFNPAIPQAVDNVLAQGLAKRPEERPASCVELVGRLELAWKQQLVRDPGATLLASWNNRPRGAAPVTPAPQVDVSAPTLQHPQGPITQPPHFPLADRVSTSGGPRPYQAGPFTSAMPTHYQMPPTQAAPSWQPGPPEEKSKVSRRSLVIAGTATAAAVAVTATGATLLPKFLSAQTTPKPAQKILGPQKLIAGIPLLSLTGHSDAVTNVVWDASGQYLASAGADTRVMLWNIAEYLKQSNVFQTVSTPLKKWKFSNAINEDSLNWSHDGRTLGVAEASISNVYLIDVFGQNDTPQAYTDASLNNPILSASYGALAWSPVNNMFAASVELANNIVLWQQNQASGPIKTFQYIPANILAIGVSVPAWSADGLYLAAQSAEYTIPVWQVKTGKQVQNLQLPLSKNAILERYALKFSPAGTNMLASSDLATVAVYDFLHNKRLYSLGTDDPQPFVLPKNNTVGWIPQVGGFSWSPNSRYIAGSYGRSGKVYIWDLKNTASSKKTSGGAIVQSLIFGATHGHTETVYDVAWSPDGRYIATSSFDKTVIIWRVDGA